MSDFCSTPGIILKKIPYSESDEIITVLLKDEGVRRFFVRGSRKSQKRYPGLIDYFAHLKFQYRPNSKGLWSLGEVQSLTQDHLGQLSMQGYALLAYLAELIVSFVPEGDGDHDLYSLWLSLSADVRKKTLEESLVNKCLTRFFAKVGYALNESMPLKDLTHFSERILQKKSHAADFFLNVIDGTKPLCL